MPVIPNTNLPYAQSEANFRRFESVIHSSLLQHPKPYLFKPSPGKALATVLARLRDARKSLKDHNWSTTIPRKEFLATYNQIKVWYLSETGQIAIATKAALKNMKPSEEAPVVINRTETINLEQFLDSFTIEVLAELADKRGLSKPVKFKYLDGDLEELQDSYDIDIESLGDNNYILT